MCTDFIPNAFSYIIKLNSLNLVNFYVLSSDFEASLTSSVKFHNLRMLEPPSNKFQLVYFYLSESILKKHFNVRHPVFYVILNFVCFSESPNFKYDIFSQVFVQGVPMGDKQKFLQRERSALTRRRQIFGFGSCYFDRASNDEFHIEF